MKKLLKLTVGVALVVALLIPAGMALAIVPPVIEVDVDVKPMSCPNPFNVGQKGVLPVAILGSEDFDVTEVDPATVRIGFNEPLRWTLEDVAGPECSEPDGYLDLTFKFKAQEITLCADDGEVVYLLLTGDLFDGTEIWGSDAVWIIRKR